MRTDLKGLRIGTEGRLWSTQSGFHPNKGDAISFLKDSFPRNIPSMELIPITAAEIKSIICSLKSKNSSGYDEITSKIFKN